MASQSYRDLEIYQLAHQLAVDLHRFSLELPKYELYEIGSQLRRSSKSVSANIVEGFGRRRYKADFVRFLVYAHASCDETIEWVQYVQDCYPDLTNPAQIFLGSLNQLGSKTNRFLQAVEAHHRSSH